MPNRFNTPIQSKPTQNYTSQFVGLPLEEMEASLQASQNQYDATDNLVTSKKSELGGIEAIGNWAQEKTAAKRKELDQFAGGFEGADLGSAEVSSKIKQKISDLSEDQDLANIQQFSQKYKMYKANLEKMKETGDYTPENTWNNFKALSRYSESGDDSGFDPVIEKGVNINEEAEKYFKALHGSSQEVMKSIADGQGDRLYYDNKQGGIGGGQVFNQAKRMLGEFKSSAAGRQAIRRQQMLAEQGDKRAASQSPDQYLATILLNAGKGFEYSDSSSGLSSVLNEKNKMGKEKKKDDAKKKQEEGSTTMGFGEVASPAYHQKLDEETGMPLFSGGAWERAATKFNELKDSGVGIGAATKGAISHAFSGDNQETEAERKAMLPIMQNYAETIKQIGKQNGGQIPTLGQWMKARQATAEKRKELYLQVPNDKKKSDQMTELFVNNRAMWGHTAINMENPGNRDETIDSIIRKELDKGPQDSITKKELADHDITVWSLPSANGFTPRGMAASINGKRYIVDMSDNLGRSGDWHPKTAEDVADINKYEHAQSELNGALHTYKLYSPKQNKDGSFPSYDAKSTFNPYTEQTQVKIKVGDKWQVIE